MVGIMKINYIYIYMFVNTYQIFDMCMIYVSKDHFVYFKNFYGKMKKGINCKIEYSLEKNK